MPEKGVEDRADGKASTASDEKHALVISVAATSAMPGKNMFRDMPLLPVFRRVSVTASPIPAARDNEIHTDIEWMMSGGARVPDTEAVRRAVDPGLGISTELLESNVTQSLAPAVAPPRAAARRRASQDRFIGVHDRVRPADAASRSITC